MKNYYHSNLRFLFLAVTLIIGLNSCSQDRSTNKILFGETAISEFPSIETSEIRSRDGEEEEDEDDKEEEDEEKVKKSDGSNKNNKDGDHEKNPNTNPVPTVPAISDTINLSLPLNIAKDINPDNSIVEINLTAMESMVEIKNGVLSKAYTYNGVIPGPMIHAKVGDTLIVNFTNNLPEPTTIHWHGIRLPADMDGASVAQNPIQPGNSFIYRFTLLDPSLFWYHPHVRSNEQVEKGLAGALLVEDLNEPADINTLPQNVIVLDDILLTNSGEIVPAFAGSPKEILLEKINGREGNTFLINGKHEPVIDAEIGKPLRWRMVNVANTRFMKISIPNTQFTRIGGEGGLITTPDLNLDNIFLVPGERADVVFTPSGADGEMIPIYWNDEVRGRHSILIENGMVIMGDEPLDGLQAKHPIAFLRLKSSTTPNIKFNPPSVLRKIDKIDITNAKKATYMFGHSMPMPNGDISFLINGKKYEDLTGADGLDVFVDDTYIWDLVNMTGGDHPFHLHGFFFQVLETIEKDENGVVLSRTTPSKIEDRDMVNLPRRPGMMGTNTTVRIAIEFTPGTGRVAQDILAFGGPNAITNADPRSSLRGHSGGWQFHCHILEHADTGMMSFINLR